ncbi:hypothetical protein GW846_03210 [Candidatus Gracilibacteria bacterium]|nr:hypothetical protein [Candidatus Gracilibacteria bacterium]
MNLRKTFTELQNSINTKKKNGVEVCPGCDHDYCSDCGCFMDKTKKEIKLLKTESHNTITFVALEPDVEDNNGDTASRDEVIKACHQFMINMQESGVTANINHEEDTDIDCTEARFVESYILPMDMEFEHGVVSKGSWLVAIKFSDALFDKVIAGEIIGISIEGWYQKELII